MFNVSENEWNKMQRAIIEMKKTLKVISQHFEKELLTADEVCGTLKISKPTFYRHIEAGHIESIKTGKTIKVTCAEVNRILEHGIYDRLNNSGKSKTD